MERVESLPKPIQNKPLFFFCWKHLEYDHKLIAGSPASNTTCFQDNGPIFDSQHH